MKLNQIRLKKFIIYSVITLQLIVISSPATTMLYAQENAVEETTPVIEQPPLSTPGIQTPTGAAAHTFIYNPESGLYENNYYTWNPNTRQTLAKYDPEHVFNSELNLWEVKQWSYVPAKDSYEYRVAYTYVPAIEPKQNEAEISDTGPTSTNNMTNQGGSITNTGPLSSNNIVSDNDNPNSLISNTGPNSSNSILLDTSSPSNINSAIELTIANTLNSESISGNADVLQNTNAGNALSGDAQTTANILNMLQSSWGGVLPELYIADIQGDYYGDIMIDPTLLTGVSNSGCNCGDLSVNTTFDANILNDVELLAMSGDATVSRNTNAGDATSGDASAMANIINMINSSITSGQSFLGILNIHGDLNGDVMVAQDVIDQLLAANVPTTELELCECGDVLVDFTNNQSISNNISTVAQSGDAQVTNNTSAGNATSGSAQTNVTVFNVTGHDIVGQNALLVFVNVLGEWVGFLVDAPAGSSAALYGGDITENSLNSSGDQEYKVETNTSITNNISVSALSGEATVSQNAVAGDATSGNAKAGANVSNIVNSNFGLSGWFGLLFINVLGDWFGSFGQNTNYGNMPNIQVVNSSQQQNESVETNNNNYQIPNKSYRTTRNLPQNNNVRVFGAVVEKNESGKVIITKAIDSTPNTSSESFGAVKSQGKIMDAIAGWSLIVMGFGAISYLFLKRLS